MEQTMKGTVTSLSSLFPVEEARKASKRLQDTISEHQKELDQLQEFVSDNTSLVKLVQNLPDKLHHEIMVPFGKAAFFPGRLIHTNEFLVLLGEGYCVDRTSKQTVEILKRRGKTLESQLESLKAGMQDLEAEASFFDATAAEAAEGLLEIREDYIEETSSEKASIAGVPDSPSLSEADNMKAAVQDDEYARILSRIDELEKEELEAENVNESDEDELSAAGLVDHISQLSTDQGVTNSELEGSNVRPVSKDESSRGKSPAFNESNFTEKDLKLPDLKENVLVEPTLKNEAFTGSIIEHAHNIETNPRQQTTARAAKPVSRFKMQRR